MQSLPIEQQIKVILLLPLLASILVGLLYKRLNKFFITLISCAALSMAAYIAVILLIKSAFHEIENVQFDLYSWAEIGRLKFKLGILYDIYTALMTATVLIVSLLVHFYSFGYMKKDPGFGRFYCYTLFFTFAMILLVLANNFLQLFIGWELVGLASYLLIGFWFEKESAIVANLKAFIVNRVGDLGFMLGIALIIVNFHSLNYAEVFATAGNLSYSTITLIALLLFTGALAKSAQIPLHVWLPDSMEGPTPISALIHAATMVTAGVFMLVRIAPLLELSLLAKTIICYVGVLTAVLLGLVAIVETDIKRIIAYSTISQLGYMIAGIGTSAYFASMFHLCTHAFFKALLFLGAGSVILALHHEQDINKMGKLYRKLPITHITMLLAAMSSIGFPGFSGFYSKELLLHTFQHTNIPYGKILQFFLTLQVFITSLYTFRMFFRVFHGTHEHVTHVKIKELGLSITLPLIILAIFSIILGCVFYNFLYYALPIMPITLVVQDSVLALGDTFQMALGGYKEPSFILGIFGIFCAWVIARNRRLAAKMTNRLKWIYLLLVHKYAFDYLYMTIFVTFTRRISRFGALILDKIIIDALAVGGVANWILNSGKLLKRLQTGYINQYIFISSVLIFIIFGINYREL